MEVYIVQENYSYTDYDSVGNEEEVVRRGIVGVCLTTEDALRTVEKEVACDCCEYHDASVGDFDIVIADTETGRLEYSSYDKIVAETKGKEEEI